MQSLTWTKRKSGVNWRNREKNKPTVPQEKNTLTFELPKTYLKRSNNEQSKSSPNIIDLETLYFEMFSFEVEYWVQHILVKQQEMSLG